MRFDQRPRDLHFEQDTERPRWVIPLAVGIVVAGAIAAFLIATSAEGGKTKTVFLDAKQPTPQHLPSNEPEQEPEPTPAPRSGSGYGGDPLGAGAAGSFETLAASLPAQVGLAVAPLGAMGVEEFGDLREGHAWSSIKVPILVTLMRERGSEGLSSDEESSAAAALTASDNEAAARLFAAIEASQGGLEGASAAVGETLASAGDASTTVATGPAPPGAVSTYGQTEWSLGGSATFYRSLAEGCLLDPEGSEYVEGLMEEVIPEQRWGLGEAGFPADWSVGIKGGWGPEGSESGPYLVRQSGIVSDGSGGIAVAMIAIDESGSYEAGAADLTQIAQWLAGRVGDRLPATSRGCT